MPLWMYCEDWSANSPPRSQHDLQFTISFLRFAFPRLLKPFFQNFSSFAFQVSWGTFSWPRKQQHAVVVAVMVMVMAAAVNVVSVISVSKPRFITAAGDDHRLDHTEFSTIYKYVNCGLPDLSKKAAAVAAAAAAVHGSTSWGRFRNPQMRCVWEKTAYFPGTNNAPLLLAAVYFKANFMHHTTTIIWKQYVIHTMRQSDFSDDKRRTLKSRDGFMSKGKSLRNLLHFALENWWLNSWWSPIFWCPRGKRKLLNDEKLTFIPAAAAAAATLSSRVSSYRPSVHEARLIISSCRHLFLHIPTS